MAESAANLVDHVLPRVPLRQFVLTLPFELRARLAFDAALLGAVNRVFVDSVLGFYRRTMRDTFRAGTGQSGAVTVVQRCSSDLRLNPHFHTLALDGVFVPSADGTLHFYRLPSLSNADVAELLHTIVVRLAAASASGLPPAGPKRRTRPPIAFRAGTSACFSSALEAELFARVQARLKANRERVAGQARHPHLLRGLLHCDSCGRTLMARALQRPPKVYRYGCNFRDKLSGPARERCGRSDLRARDIEDAVWNDLAQWPREPQQLARQLQAQSSVIPSLLEAQAAELRTLKNQLRSLEQSTRCLVDAYQAGALPLPELKARRERLEEQKKRSEHRLQELSRQQRRALEQRKVIDEVSSLCTTKAPFLRAARRGSNRNPARSG